MEPVGEFSRASTPPALVNVGNIEAWGAMSMAFKDPANTACLMCEHVLSEHLPILYVSHEQDDGTWIFLCNVRDHDIGNNDILLVALHEAADLDRTIDQIADLPLGFIATRTAVGQPWLKRPDLDTEER
jgi:hypothetical protein